MVITGWGVHHRNSVGQEIPGLTVQCRQQGTLLESGVRLGPQTPHLLSMPRGHLLCQLAIFKALESI